MLPLKRDEPLPQPHKQDESEAEALIDAFVSTPPGAQPANRGSETVTLPPTRHPPRPRR
jgi:hypothetical protein